MNTRALAASASVPVRSTRALSTTNSKNENRSIASPMNVPSSVGPTKSIAGFDTMSTRTGASDRNSSFNSAHARRFTTSAYAECKRVIEM